MVAAYVINLAHRVRVLGDCDQRPDHVRHVREAARLRAVAKYRQVLPG